MATTREQRSVTGTVAALALADIAFAFQQTAVIPAIPAVQQDFHASETWSAWLLTGYLVLSSVATPLLGKLADRYGKRRLLLVSLAIFLGGSIGAALAPSIGVLIVFRAVQGGGGAVFPLTLSMLRDEVPAERVGGAVGALTGTFGLGTTLGFGISGLIVSTLGWRYIFACGAVLTVAALLLTPKLLPRSRITTPGGLDLPGAALFTGGLAALLVALTEGEASGWAAPLTLACFVAFVVLLAGWIVRDLRTEEPLLDLRVLGERTVFLANASTTMLGYVVFGLFFLIPYLARDVFGVGAIDTSLYLLPAAVGQLVGGPASGWLGRRIEEKWVLTGGMVITTAGAAALAVWHTETAAVLALDGVLGLGFGLSVGVVSAIITQSVHESQTGIATALNSVLRRVGGGVGGQVSAVLLAAIAFGPGHPKDSAFALAFGIAAVVAAIGACCALGVRSRRGG